MALIFILLTLAAVAAYPACAAMHTFSASGRVIDGFEQAVEGANVTLLDTNGRAFAQTCSTADGSYRLTSAAADTDAFSVQVSYRHGDRLYTAPAGDTRWLRPSEDMYIDTDLTRLKEYFPFKTGYLRGRVVRADAPSGTINATVYVRNIASIGTKDGSFVFIVPPGTYDIFATHGTPYGRFVSDTMKVTVNASDSIGEAPPLTLTVKREGLTIADPAAFALSLLAGFLCLGGMGLALKKL